MSLVYPAPSRPSSPLICVCVCLCVYILIFWIHILLSSQTPLSLSLSLNFLPFVSLSLPHQCWIHFIKDDKIPLTHLTPDMWCSHPTWVFSTPKKGGGWDGLPWFDPIPARLIVVPKTTLCINIFRVLLKVFSSSHMGGPLEPKSPNVFKLPIYNTSIYIFVGNKAFLQNSLNEYLPTHYMMVHKTIHVY